MSSLWQSVARLGRGGRTDTQTQLLASEQPPPDKMKQWTTAMNGVDKLKLAEVDVPTVGDGEVLVKVLAVSLNRRDLEVCSGTYSHAPSLLSPGEPIVPCSDMCGRVVASRSARFAPGALVLSILLQSHLDGALAEDDLASALGYPLPGVLAQYRVLRAEALVAAPAHLSAAEASCLPVAAVTAWTGLNWMRPLGRHVGTTAAEEEGEEGARPPRTVLLQGTGDVCLAGLQLAHAAGLRTIVTSASDDALRRARDDLGADEGINHTTHWEWAEPVKEATGGRGADLIFETGGARTLRKSFAAVAFGGFISCVGDAAGGERDGEDGDGGGGKAPQLHRLDVNGLALRRSVTLRGVVSGGRDRFEEMLGFYADKELRPVVDRVFSFDEAKEALGYLQGGERFGKVVIEVAE